MPFVRSVNVGRGSANPWKSGLQTGIGKQPAPGPVEVRAPGPKTVGLGSGLVDDFIGDGRHHGGDAQAVYAFQREDLDDWERRLGRPLTDGQFGENLTTVGLEVSSALIGERWRIGEDVVLQVTLPRVPCGTFRGWIGEVGWARTFTAVGRTGAYLSVLQPGFIASADPIEVIHVPDHDVTVDLVFRATTTDRSLLPRLLAAGPDLDPEVRRSVASRTLITLDPEPAGSAPGPF